MSNPSYSLGIDIGTTFTAVAICREGRAEIAPLGVRGWSVPSVVFIGPENVILVGDSALRRSNTDPARVAREFKRRIGDPVPLMVGGSPMSADALTGMVLRSVLDQVLALEVGDPDHAVVTHPANWGPYKTDLLQQAIRMSGLDQRCPVSMMSEPEAAAAHYAGSERLNTGEVVAVYDLGGGTFDAAVLRTTEHGWEFLAPAEGVERLGGIDFDEAVFNHVDEMLGGAIRDLDAADPAAVSGATQLRKDCVEAKEALSSDVSTTISVALPNIHTEVRLTRPEFEAMIRPSVEVSVDAMRRALRASQVGPADLRAVLLVGGSSRIPLISQAVSEAFHVPIAADAHPKHSVALGAALTAYHRAHVAAAPTEALVPPADPDQPGTSGGSLSRWFFGGRTGTEATPPEPATVVVPPSGRVPFVPTRGPEDPTIGLRASRANGPSAPSTPTGPPSQPIRPIPVADADPPTPRRRKAPVPLIIGIVVALLLGGVVAIITTSGDGEQGKASAGTTSLTASTTSDVSSDVSSVESSTSELSTSSASSSSESATASDTGTAGVVVTESSAPPSTGGAVILFETQRDDSVLPQIWRININGTGERPVIVSSPPQADGQPSGSSKGKQLAYLHRSTDDDSVWTLYKSSFDGSGAGPIADNLGRYSRPAWSPDETKIVVPLTAVGSQKTDLFLINLSNPSEPVQLTFTTEQEVDPSWSPDGNFVVFRRDIGENGDAEIFKLDMRDPSIPAVQLTTHPGYDSDPRFSPDGTQLMITRKVDPNLAEEDIVLIDPNIGDAGYVVNLTNTPIKEQDAEWTPDGKQIVYQGFPGGDGEIFVMNADGSGQTQLTFNPGNDGTPTVFSTPGT